MGQLYCLPIMKFDERMLPVLKNNFEMLENIINGHIEAENLADDLTASGTYDGNGAANRFIDVGFSPRHVIILNHTDLFTLESIGEDGTSFAAWYRNGDGTIGADAGQFTGIVAGGFKCGTATASISNKQGSEYSWFATR